MSINVPRNIRKPTLLPILITRLCAHNLLTVKPCIERTMVSQGKVLFLTTKLEQLWIFLTGWTRARSRRDEVKNPPNRLAGKNYMFSALKLTMQARSSEYIKIKVKPNRAERQKEACFHKRNIRLHEVTSIHRTIWSSLTLEISYFISKIESFRFLYLKRSNSFFCSYWFKVGF